MYCKKCGNKLNEGDTFCDSCGSKIVAANSNKEIKAIEIQSKDNQVQETKRKNPGVLTGLLIGVGGILIICLILAVTGIISVGKGTKNSQSSADGSNLEDMSEGEDLRYEFTLKSSEILSDENRSKDTVQNMERGEVVQTKEKSTDDDRGILAIYSGLYNTEKKASGHSGFNDCISLVWINPETEESTEFREFYAESPDIIIDPDSFIEYMIGKDYLRELFDENFDRIVAKNIVDGSCGWMDTTGTYTNISKLIEEIDPIKDEEIRYSDSIGFFDGYYYFMYRDCTYDPYYDVVDYGFYKIPIDRITADQLLAVESYDYIDNCYGSAFIQYNKGKDKIFSITSFRPKYYDNGHSDYCVDAPSYSDWISEECAIGSHYNGCIYIIKTKNVPHDILPEHDSNERPIELWERYQEETILESEYIESSKEKTMYYNPIMNPKGNSFVCTVEHTQPREGEEPNRYIKTSSFAIYTLNGDTVKTLDILIVKEIQGKKHGLAAKTVLLWND